jgi:hypothetical protein
VKSLNAKTDPARKFSSIVNSAQSDFNRLTAEDHGLTNEEWNRLAIKVANEGSEGHFVSKATVDAVKRAVLCKAREKRATIEEGRARAVANVRDTVLRNRGLTEVTKAGKTIETNYKPVSSLEAQLPPEFKSNPKMRVGDEYLAAVAAHNAEHKQGWKTAAQKTLDRPKPAFRDNEADQQLPQAATTTDSGKISRDPSVKAKTIAPEWNANLKSPRRPAQGFASVNGAI